MMKRMSRYTRASRLLVLIMCALLLAGMLPSFGALGATKKNSSTGSLTVSLKSSIMKKLPKGAKVEFTLYKIGKAAPETAAGWEFNSDLSKFGNKIIAAKEDSALQEVVNDLAEEIVGKYKGTTKDLSSGSAEFKNLDDGVYLGVLTEGPAGLSAEPSLITVPSRDPKDATQLRYNYDVTVKGVYTPTAAPTVTATPKPTVTSKPTATPKPTVTATSTATATPAPTATPTTEPDDDTPGTPGGPGVPAATPTPTVDITGTKIWDDDGNIHNVRPGSITVTLYADGSPVSAEPSWSKRGDRWTFTFSGLPKVDSNGSEISYTVQETPVNLYESSVSGMTITNRLIPREPERYTDLSGEKVWDDNDNVSGRRPTSVTVRLLRDGIEVDSRNVTAGTNWKFTFQHLPVDDGYGHTYTYEIREDGVSGYFSRIDGTTVTNKLIDGTTPSSPTPDGENPPPDGTTPNTPQRPEDVPDRNTGTPVPHFETLTDENLEELFDLFGYGSPLYGMLGTGDQIPVWVWACGGVGIIALATAIITGRKKKKTK